MKPIEWDRLGTGIPNDNHVVVAGMRWLNGTLQMFVAPIRSGSASGEVVWTCVQHGHGQWVDVPIALPDMPSSRS